MKYVTLDLEYDEDELLCVGVKPDDGEVEVIPAEEFPSSPVHIWLLDETLPKVTFTKADHRWLMLHGYEVNGPVHDVQVMAWAIDETTELSLEWCVARYLGEYMDKRISVVAGDLKFKRDDGTLCALSHAPREQLHDYNARDILATEKLYEKLLEGLKYDGLEDYWRGDCVPLSRVLVEMEAAGLPVDIEKSKELRVRLEGEMDDLRERLTIGSGLPADFNVASSDQLAKRLYAKSFELRGAVPITKDERGRLKNGMRVVLPDGFQVGKVGLRYAHGIYELPGLGLAVRRRTDKGKPSTDAKTLAMFYGENEWVAMLLEWKKRATIVQTFLRNFEGMEKVGRIYGRFNQTGTKTGRLSSSGPNLQNIPARGELGHAVRSLFVPERGTVFIHGDYSMLEPRLMAHFSQDPLLLDIFRNGRDIYIETAERIFGESGGDRRSVMKTFILGMGYGAGPDTLQRTLAVAGFPMRLDAVEKTLAALQEVYRRYFDWKLAVIAEASKTRHVQTLAGHHRRLARRGPSATWKELGHDERAAVNAIIQGSAADIVARTMVGIRRDVPEVRIIGQVHDELLMEWEGQGEEHDLLVAIQYIAEEGHGFDLSVPLKFEPRVVRSWAEGKD